MDSMIPNGQKNTIAEYMMLSGADNRLPMLDKPLYDSWKRKMELYIQNREHGRMILESVEHGLLDWPSIEVNGVTRLKKTPHRCICSCESSSYCQGSMGTSPTTHARHFIDKTRKIVQIDSGLAVHVFKQGDDPIDAITKMMSFLSTVITSCFPSTNNQLRNSSNPRQQATIHDGRCPKPKRKRDATWFSDKVLLVEAQGSAYQADNLDVYDSECDDFSTAKAVLMANLSSYSLDVLSKKVKEMDNIVCKMGQSAKTVHMLTKPQVFYGNNLKQALGFQNPFYHKKAQHIRPMLYDGSVIAKETIVILIADSEETLMLEEESRSKILLKQSDPMVLEKKVNIKPINYAELNRLSEDFGKHFIPQQKLSNEQAFWLQLHTLKLTNLLLRLSKLRLIENFLRFCCSYTFPQFIIMSNINNNMQTQTSNTLHNAIMEAGSKDRPPMLAPGNYIQWKSRIKRYIDTKPNRELIHYYLENPPYELGWNDKFVNDAEGNPTTETC
nr:hypothetical protein [Tanacetum cinerariifolium]